MTGRRSRPAPADHHQSLKHGRPSDGRPTAHARGMPAATEDNPMDNETKKIAVAFLHAAGHSPVEGIACQRHACTAFAERQGLSLKGVFIDHTGGTRSLGHGGLQGLLRGAAAGDFGVVIVESLDRLSRDTAHVRRLVTHLSNLGIELHRASSGKVSVDDLFMRGLMSEAARDNQRRRIQWGVRNAARRGQVSGRRPYGYALLPGSRGGLRIDAGQAEIVREAFRLFGNGMSTRDVAKALNARPAPDRTWTADSVRNLLKTDLYDGRIVHGRTTRVRDELTGRSRAVVCPDEHWTVVAAEHLRIVDVGSWARARELLAERAQLIRRDRGTAAAGG